MSLRQWCALGTGSQVPTKQRNHNGHFLRWDDTGFLFDPGEGTQRQMAFADLPASAIEHILITHFHGDHCLGLAGIIQRLSLDRVPHPVSIYYPESGQSFFERLRFASIYYPAVTLEPRPIRENQTGLFQIAETPQYTLFAHALEHGVPTFGYRLKEKDSKRMLPERLAEFGVSGPAVGQLIKEGQISLNGKTITVADVSVDKPGAVVAFVMDTRVCDGAFALAQGADLLVMEATYSAEDQALATEHGHCSSLDAARVAKESGVQKLAITHFSQRYFGSAQHVAEARQIFENTVALDDLTRVNVPRNKG